MQYLTDTEPEYIRILQATHQAGKATGAAERGTGLEPATSSLEG